MSEKTAEGQRRGIIVWGALMLAASGLVFLVPYLILGSSQPDGGEGWTSEGMLMVFVFFPISGVVFCSGVVTLLLGSLRVKSSPPTTKTTDAAIIKKPGRYQG